MSSTAEIDPRTTLAELATTRAGAWRVLHRLGLDVCCGGAAHLDHACADLGLEVDDVLAALARDGGQDPHFERWDQRATGSLVDHILERFHERHREQLARLIALADAVETAEAAHARCPRGLRVHLGIVHDALEHHMRREERKLFPLLRAGDSQTSITSIECMEEEHHLAGTLLEKIRELTDDLAAPDDASEEWRTLYAGLLEFEEDLVEHVHLENNVLFPRMG